MTKQLWEPTFAKPPQQDYDYLSTLTIGKGKLEMKVRIKISNDEDYWFHIPTDNQKEATIMALCFCAGYCHACDGDLPKIIDYKRDQDLDSIPGRELPFYYLSNNK